MSARLAEDAVGNTCQSPTRKVALAKQSGVPWPTSHAPTYATRGLRLLLGEAQQLRVGIIPISFHIVSASEIRRHAGMSCMTEFCQQKRLPLLLGKYHLSANLSPNLQIFVLFHEKSNFYFMNIYLPLSMCIYILLYIQYLAGIFKTQPLKQQKVRFFNPYVSLANSLYPSILGRKKALRWNPSPFLTDWLSRRLLFLWCWKASEGGEWTHTAHTTQKEWWMLHKIHSILLRYGGSYPELQKQLPCEDVAWNPRVLQGLWVWLLAVVVQTIWQVFWLLLS